MHHHNIIKTHAQKRLDYIFKNSWLFYTQQWTIDVLVKYIHTHLVVMEGYVIGREGIGTPLYIPMMIFGCKFHWHKCYILYVLGSSFIVLHCIFEFVWWLVFVSIGLIVVIDILWLYRCCDRGDLLGLGLVLWEWDFGFLRDSLISFGSSITSLGGGTRHSNSWIEHFNDTIFLFWL